MGTTLTISKQVFLPNLTAGFTYPLDTYAPFGYTVTQVYQIQTSSGSVTAALKINGTNITGLSSISVTSTPQNVAATAANTVSVGDALSLVFSSNSLAQNIQFTLMATRNAVASVSNSDGTLTVSPTTGDVVASLAPLTSAKFLVGNSSNVATGVTMSGDATLANTGALTIANNAVTNAKAAQMTANTIKGNLTGSTANAADNTLAAISAALAATMQNYFSGGYVNKFRNGAMDIWQRTTSSTTITTSGAYLPDGWIIIPTGASCTAQRTTSNTRTAALSTYSLLMTGATSVTGILVKQRIESVIAQQLEGQQVTVQAQVYNNTGASITPTLTVKRAGSTDNWSSPTTDVNAVSLQACANGAWTRIAYTFASSSSSGNGLEITFDFGNNFSTTGKSVQITELDIRVTSGVSTGLNSSPPVPEVRPVHAELVFCQRYLCKTFQQGTPPTQAAGLSTGEIFLISVNASSNANSFLWQFPVTMRTAPTVTTYNPISSNANWRDTTANVDLTVNSLGNYDNKAGFFVQASVTVGNNIRIHALATAEL